MAISSVTLGCIAYDRYLKVTLNDTYSQKMNKCKVNLMILLPWCTPIPLFLSKLFGPFLNNAFVITVVVLMYTLVVFSYRALMKIVKTSYKTNEEMRLRQRKSVIFMGWIVFTALACTCPVVIRRTFSIIHLTCDWKFYSENEPLILAIVQVIFLLNSSLNPLLYFYLHPGFKAAVKKIFHKQRVVKIYPSEQKPQ